MAFGGLEGKRGIKQNRGTGRVGHFRGNYKDERVSVGQSVKQGTKRNRILKDPPLLTTGGILVTVHEWEKTATREKAIQAAFAMWCWT